MWRVRAKAVLVTSSMPNVGLGYWVTFVLNYFGVSIYGLGIDAERGCRASNSFYTYRQ
jgi:hypothetical protein